MKRPEHQNKTERSFFVPFDHPIEVRQTREVTCNLCGSAGYRPLGIELSFEIRECDSCGLVYVSPQPSEEDLARICAAMYPDADDESASQRTLGLVEPHLRSIIWCRKPKAKTLLDVGCGYGVFLKFMKGHGLQLHGIEMSATAADYTQRVLPEAVIVQGDLASAEFEPGSMDVITMIAALEHVFDPRATLRQLTRWLAPEGLLIVQVPYTTPYLKLKRFIPWLPVYLAAPAHLYDFNPTTLRRYFDVAGLKHSEIDIARPYAAPSRLSALAIWGVKLPGIALHRISGRRYVYPFASAIVCHGVKTV